MGSRSSVLNVECRMFPFEWHLDSIRRTSWLSDPVLFRSGMLCILVAWRV